MKEEEVQKSSNGTMEPTLPNHSKELGILTIPCNMADCFTHTNPQKRKRDWF